MDVGSLSGLAKVFSPFAKSALRGAARLYAERQAGADPSNSDTTLLEDSLRETLNRLSGGQPSDSWWRRILTTAGHAYVAPDWLGEAAVQKWLSTSEVRESLLAVARAEIMSAASDREASIRENLFGQFSHDADETAELAADAVDVVIGILAAGYMATIPKEQRALAGMVQEVHREVSRLGTNYPEGAHTKVGEVHSREAEQALDRVLLLRMFDAGGATRDVRELWTRVSEGGDLASTETGLKCRIRYWAARLCAVAPASLALAQELRRDMRPGDTDERLVVVDAWMDATSGNPDRALRRLRAVDDPDARANLLVLLARERGEAAALDRFADTHPLVDRNTFTDLGWKVWAVSLARLGRWTDAAEGLRALADSADWNPGLAVVEATINAALLIPVEQRGTALEGVPLYGRIAPRVDPVARRYHTRAAECFEYVDQRLAEIGHEGFARTIAQWRQWTRLMDPVAERQEAAREEVRVGMADEAMAVNTMPVAWAFGIEFDSAALRTILSHNRRFGGLDDEEVVSECLLNHVEMTPSDFAAYIDSQTHRLDEVMDRSQVTSMLFESLLRDGQIDRARRVLSTRTAAGDDVTRERMEAALDDHEGKDPRARLEATYDKTGSLVDLRNLIFHLRSVGDDAAVGPCIRALFDRDPTLENGWQVVQFLGRPESVDHHEVLVFLDQYPELVQQSDEMRAARAWALYHQGELAKAREVNDQLVERRQSEGDIALDVSIAVSQGDWERLPVILDRAWRRRGELSAAALMMFARHADQSERALELARLAVAKAPNNPHVLTGAYGLHFELGRDEEADPDWLANALEASSSTDGPMWQTDLDHMVNEMLPRQREHQGKVERMLMEGQAPMALAFGVFNMPLSRVLLETSIRNSRTQDGRRRIVLPIVSGNRKPTAIDGGWTIGLDLTSIYVLDYLGLLDVALNSISHVKITAETMESLYLERFAVRFHQPARIKAAKEIQRIVNGGHMRRVDATSAPAELVDEVGQDLAQLLQTCRRDQGVVICVRPIHRVRSLMEEVADTSAYDDIIFSPADLCLAVHGRGLTDGDQHERARAFLASQGQVPDKEMSRELLNGPIFLDGLALSYLQNARLLDVIAGGSLDVRVHGSVIEESVGLIDAGDAGVDLSERIDGIRTLLSSGIESKKVSFLPRARDVTDDAADQRPSVRSLESLIGAASVCDALCVDDRYMNAHREATARSGESVPTVCVLDVLRHLVREGVMAEADYWKTKHRLRQGGFALIPTERSELEKWLRTAAIGQERVVETAELKVIRQSMHRLDSLDLLKINEAATYVGELLESCGHAIRSLWTDNSVPVEHAEGLGDWVWRHLMSTTFVIKGRLEGDPLGNARREMVTHRLGLIALPLLRTSTERRSTYSRWLERSVFGSLKPANGDVISQALEGSLSTLQSAGRYSQVVASMFIEGLPDSLRAIVVSKAPDFARQCGFESTTVVSIGARVAVSERELFKAAESVLAGSQNVAIKDRSGRGLTVRTMSDPQRSGVLAVDWIENNGGPRSATFEDLALLSPDVDVRRKAFERIQERLGPTARIPMSLSGAISSRKLTYDEISLLLGETGKGVRAFQTRLHRKLTDKLDLQTSDFVPQSMAYWERLCGPKPQAQDPERYLRRVIGLRKAMIKRDLAGGLGVSCLGALRDDLLPGQWIEGHDDDAVWDALMTVDLRYSPISILAGLDIALYRTNDERFGQFATDAINRLLDDNLGLGDDYEIHRVFHVISDFVMNALSFADGMSAEPGYWRRMCAWMQAGLILRTCVSATSPGDLTRLAEGFKTNMPFGGEVRRAVDCREEPMVLASQLGAQSLRYEVGVRLIGLKTRHERGGRGVPMADEIMAVLDGMSDEGAPAIVPIPGPCAFHRRPEEPMPSEIIDLMAGLWSAEDNLQALEFLAGASQLYAVDSESVRNVENAIQLLGEVDDVQFRSVLPQVHSASVLAAAARDHQLADAVGDLVGRLAPVMADTDVQWAVRGLLQTSAAYEEEVDCLTWLEDRFVELATGLPGSPETCLGTFLWCVEAIEPVLRVDHWFHLRAKAIATSGAI